MSDGSAPLDYRAICAARRPAAATWDAFVREALVAAWTEAYRQATPWDADIVEVSQGELTYLFDGAPTFTAASRGDDRVVAVWGHSRSNVDKRDSVRQAGFIPRPSTWSNAGRDRGHFVAHSAGGGLDLNLFPQAIDLNRGLSEQGKGWKAMERYVAAHPGTPLFVRPTYEDTTWVPTTIDFGVLREGGLWWEPFRNGA